MYFTWRRASEVTDQYDPAARLFDPLGMPYLGPEGLREAQGSHLSNIHPRKRIVPTCPARFFSAPGLLLVLGKMDGTWLGIDWTASVNLR